MKGKTKMMIAAIVVIMAGIYYYAAIPAINIHSSETWFFIMVFLVILAVLYLGRKKMNRYEIKENKVVKVFLGVVVVLGAVYLLGTLLSSPVVNAKKYQKLMTVKEGEFAKDVEERTIYITSAIHSSRSIRKNGSVPVSVRGDRLQCFTVPFSRTTWISPFLMSVRYVKA